MSDVVIRDRFFSYLNKECKEMVLIYATHIFDNLKSG